MHQAADLIRYQYGLDLPAPDDARSLIRLCRTIWERRGLLKSGPIEPPERAARALAALPESLQADIVRRLARLDGADSLVLRDIEAGLEQRYRRRFAFAGRRAVGLGGVKQIFSEAGPEVRGKWLTNISRHDPNLASQLAGPAPQIAFDDLERLTDASLRLLLDHTDEDVVVAAMAGADLKTLNRLNAVLPRVRAAQLRRRRGSRNGQHLGDRRLRFQQCAREPGVQRAVHGLRSDHRPDFRGRFRRPAAALSIERGIHPDGRPQCRPFLC